MIIPFCLLVIIGLGHCQDEMLSRYQIQTSINRTIDEVERLIQEDPKLPRLSRAEIVDILFNITSKDVDKLAEKNSVNKAREEYQKALMVVLPYSPNSSNDNLEDLYTKAPMVQMFPDASKTDNFQMIYENGKNEEIVYPEKFHESNLAIDSPSTNFVVSGNLDDSNLAEGDTEESNGSYENHRDTYSEVIDPIDFKKSSDGSYHSIYQNVGKRRPVHVESPERFSFDLNNLQVTPKSTTSYSNIQEDVQPDDSLPTDSKLEIIYSTTVNTKKPPTTKAVKEAHHEETTESATNSPSTTHRHVLTSDQWHYNAPPTTMETPKKVYPEYKFHTETMSSVTETSQGEFDPETPPSTTTKKPDVMIKIQGQNSEKKHESKVHLVAAEKPNPVHLTPMSSNPADIMKSKFSSSYSANHRGVSKVSGTMPPMRSEVKDLLKSIGLSEDNPDQQPQVGSSMPIPGSNNLLGDQISALAAAGIGSPSILSHNTFGGESYDHKKGTLNLTPDMQLLLQRFGLQTSVQSEKPSTTTKKPTPIVVNLNSYSSFRPLPDANVENEDMKDFLAKFGLGTSESEKNRNHKSIKTRKNAEVTKPSLIEAVPDSMKKILENIGLITRSQKSVEVKSTTLYSPESSTTPKFHVFKPHEVPRHTEEQKEKINKLLDTVKRVQSGSADSQDVQAAAKDLMETAKKLQSGPDPVTLEEILAIYNEGIKNEVKRQEEVTTTEGDSGATTPLATETSTSAPSATTTSTIATIASEATNVDALADSFGGSTRAPDPVLPMQRRTGLYFLVDWNTFLDVGVDGPDRVNLRFQPKVGDRTRFIPVTVP